MNAVFAAQRDGSGNAVYESMGYSGGLAAIVRAVDRADASAIVGSNIVIVVFGDELGDIVLYEAADSLDIEGVSQQTILATIASSEAADTIAVVGQVLSTVHATVAVSDAADSADVELASTATTTADLTIGEIADAAALSVLTVPVADMTISEAADSASILGVGSGGAVPTWQAVFQVQTVWTPVNA